MSRKRSANVKTMTLDEIMKEVMTRAHECGDCLVWTGATSTGKPGGTPKFRNISLRRLLWTKRARRPVPTGKMVTSTCETADCIAHLGLTDKSGAAKKGYADIDVRLRKSAANRRTAQSAPWVKLSPEKAAYIRASDKPGTVLAAELGVDKTLISKVRLGHAWVAVNDPLGGVFSGLIRRAA